MLPSAIIIAFVLLIVARTGFVFTKAGMGWYEKLSLPPWTPPGQLIGLVWSVIYVLTGISAFLFWNDEIPDAWRLVGIICFLLNAILNVLWTVVFFRWHSVGGALAESLLLEMSVVALIIILLPFNLFAALLLVPYMLWVLFASFLTFTVWQVNR